MSIFQTDFQEGIVSFNYAFPVAGIYTAGIYGSGKKDLKSK